MSQRYLGGVITANPTTPTMTTESGVWTLEQQFQYSNVWSPKIVGNSVRFRSSASANLQRTFVSSNRKTWTWSGWVKRGLLANRQGLFSAGLISGTYHYHTIHFDSNDKLNVVFYPDTTSTTVITTRLFRDPSAWYHIVVAFDTTQATAANRVRIYVNGVQETAFDTASYSAQNTDGYINSTTYNSGIHYIGRFTPSDTAYLDGYLGEINFVDGQALTPSSFGALDSTGVWQPLPYTGTYGTNGFYLTFSDNSAATAAALGKDTSGNGNNWTPNNISLTAGSTYDWMLDSPTNWTNGTGNGVANYCTLNPLRYSTNGTLSEANLKYSNGSGDNGAKAIATFGIPSGKWYWEGSWISGPSNSRFVVGFASSSTAVTSASMPFERDGSNLGLAANDIANVAIDFDAGKIWYGKNNVWQSSGDPATGANPIQTFTPSTYDFLYPGIRCYSASDGTTVGVANFGQRPLSYTPPTGFKALNTLNLPDPTIMNGAQYMAATLWTGTQAARAINNSVNGVAFQPDFLWTKSRSNVEDHRLSDSVRGGNGTVLGTLASNTTGAEAFDTDVTGFASTGFNIRAGTNSPNVTGRTYVGWQWQAGKGVTSSNTNGTITSTTSVSTTAGFSVLRYNGNGTSGATIGHGLGVTPKMYILKRRDASGYNWIVQTTIIDGSLDYLFLNTTAAKGDSGDTPPTSSVISVSGNADVNASGGTYVAYLFAPVSGYSAFGSYTGNGSSSGPFVYLGFRPRWILIKRSDTSGTSWCLVDSSRSPNNTSVNGGMQNTLFPNVSNAEDTGADICDGLSNGFRFYQGASSFNANGGTYIYAAFAENPFKIARAR